MKKIFISFVIASSALVLNTRAFASSPYILTIAGVASPSIQENENKTQKNIIYSGGFLIEEKLEEVIGLESGIILINRQYDFRKDNYRVIENVKKLHVPLTARFWPVKFFSIAFGPFIEVSTGDVKTVLVEGSTFNSEETSAEDNIEFGVDTALTLNIDIDSSSAFFLETRYSQIAGLKEEEKINSLSALAGIQMTI